MTENTQKPGPDPKILLRLSEQFLRRRYFTDCRKYAHQAHQLDPNLPGAAEILAVADVLLSSEHQTSTGTLRDWYEVMKLDHYTHGPNLINKQYGHLYHLLNPSTNKLPFAEEAFEIVCDAWRVLTDRVKKSEFDCLLKMVVDCEDVMWTACPYCYYLYEYPRVYSELCLRCPNDDCGKAFTCVEIEHPPDEVLNVGKYVCDGFVMLGLKNGGWNPFATVNKQKPKVDDNDYDKDNDKFVTISDDDDDDKVVVKRDLEKDESTVKPILRRKKSAARNTKKVTGAGNRVRKEVFVHQEESDDCEFF